MNRKRAPEAAAAMIAGAYEEYRLRFRQITGRARRRFEGRDWEGAQDDALDRLLLYGEMIHRAVRAARMSLGADPEPQLGATMRAAYSELSAGRPDVELAQTFFNSAQRRLFGTVGVNWDLEYAGEGVADPPIAREPVYRSYPFAGGLAPAIEACLAASGLSPWADREGDASLAAAALEAELGGPASGVLEMIPQPFFRNKGAYLVGRIAAVGAPDGASSPPSSAPRAAESAPHAAETAPHAAESAPHAAESAPRAARGEYIPLILALLHGDGGITVDAVLPTSNEASIVFGFTRSYFHVETEHPGATVRFLQSIMPLKRIDELYTAIGFNRHGKTELYRALLRHVEQPDARFEPAPGEPGLVMSVFTLPSFNVVFKIIKDAFGPPKRTTRRAVMEKYRFVFVRDRVGRLADAQEFERLELKRESFSGEVLDELLGEASRSVHVEGDRVVIEHAYTERRVTPLNLFLREAAPQQAEGAVVDFGYAIKDLACANIFPGDMLLKNFGITRHGRVIFYDYDEIGLLTDCRFRHLPDLDDLYGSEGPAFYAAENEVFPEEFDRFMVLPGRLGEVFRRVHSDLFDVGFWRTMQESQRAGEVVDFFAYKQSRRLRRG